MELNSIKMRDQLDVLLDQLAEKIAAEANAQTQQSDGDMVYEQLVANLRELAGESSPDFLAGFRNAIEVVVELLPPGDEIVAENPLPEI